MTTRKRRKPGPRPGTTGAGRTARLHLRVSPEEHAAYAAAAARQGVSVAEWARVALEDVSRIEAQLPPRQPLPRLHEPADEPSSPEQRDHAQRGEGEL